jgi:lysophospholipase L1-like esterase
MPSIPKYKDNFLNYRDLLEEQKWRLSRDNLHLNDKGHKELASRVFDRLKLNKG